MKTIIELQRKDWALVCVILTMLADCLVMAPGCVTTGEFTRNAYRTLSTAAGVYEAFMQSAKALYSGGHITAEEIEKINELGTLYWSAYHSAATALAVFERARTVENRDRLEKALAAMNAAYADMLVYLEPILKRGD